MSVILGRALSMGGSTAKRLEFEYTGTYNERIEDGVVEFLTSGALTFKKETPIDVFLVGGGAGGARAYINEQNSGGGGGYTKTLLNITPRKNQSYQIVVGAGGSQTPPTANVGSHGGKTSAFGESVNGGTWDYSTNKPNGGSGGGGGEEQGANRAGQPGASDGGSGKDAYSRGGTGQGTTTREFGEATGKLYAGGGGGGGGYHNGGKAGGAGGAGGGGAGGTGTKGHDGEANTGGGGGGGGNAGGTRETNGGAGGSGIVCIRLHKEKP